MKTAIIYTRVSTDEQAQPGHFSIDTQRELCFKKAEELGYKISGVFNDEGVSGKETSRPAFNKLLKQVNECDDVGAVIILHTDRLARNAQFHMETKDKFRKKGIKLISVFQGEVLYSADGTFTDNMMALVNQHYSDLIAEKTKNGLEKKAKEGWLPGEAPLGYKNTGDKLEDRIRVITINKSVAPFIQMAFRLFASNNYSIDELGDILYKKGFRSKRGYKMSSSKLNYLLKNRFYIGELRWGKIHLIKAKHKPLIDRNLFDVVQQVFADHNHHACRRRKYQYLLRGFLYCVCGARMTASKVKNKTKDYYFCNKRKICHESYVPMEKIETEVEQFFQKIQFSEEFINLVMTKVRAGYNQMKENDNSRRQELVNQKTALENKRNKAEEKLLEGIIADEDFSRLRAKLKKELDDIESQLSELNAQKELKVDQIQEVLNFTKNIYEAYKKASPELKKRYLGLFVDKFVISARKIKKPVLSPIFAQLLVEQKAFYKTQKPFHSEMAFVAPSGTYLPDQVKIRNEWGG